MRKILLFAVTCAAFAATANGLALGARVEVECIAAAVDKSTGHQRN